MDWQDLGFPCPLCSLTSAKGIENRANRWFAVKCDRCGEYEVTQLYISQVRGEGQRPHLSGVMRDASERGQHPRITIDNADELEQLAPTTVQGKLVALLRAIARKSKSPGSSVRLTDNDYPLVYGAHAGELREYLSHLKEKGMFSNYFCTTVGYDLSLSIPAWEFIEAANKPNAESERAFVAMWFHDLMTPIYKEAIKPAIEAAGYQSIRIDKKDHNNKIDDEIIAEIKQSRFLVADFTGNRGGVYFEAGFAKGLGLEVIWACRSDSFEDLHFDTRQFNHIGWNTPEELREALTNRIFATVGKGPRMK